MDRFMKLMQIQKLANIDDAIIAVILAEMGINHKNEYRNNIYILETIESNESSPNRDAIKINHSS